MMMTKATIMPEGDVFSRIKGTPRFSNGLVDINISSEGISLSRAADRRAVVQRACEFVVIVAAEYYLQCKSCDYGFEACLLFLGFGQRQRVDVARQIVKSVLASIEQLVLFLLEGSNYLTATNLQRIRWSFARTSTSSETRK